MRYAFVSNGDNLGATADPRVAGWFASSGRRSRPRSAAVRRPTARAGTSRSARRDGQLVLRDSAQTAPEDAGGASQTSARHRYFNTNNLWIDLDALRRDAARATTACSGCR